MCRKPEVTRILTALGFEVSESAPAVLSVRVPTWRATKDVSLKDDLVEEIGRMVGYDSITPTPPWSPPPFLPPILCASICANCARNSPRKASRKRTTIRSSPKPISSALAAIPPRISAVQNPIASELTHLRRSLLPGLFKSIVANVRFFPEFRLFEIGNEIHPRRADCQEVTHLAAVFYSAHGEDQEFFELKRVLECAVSRRALARGRTAGLRTSCANCRSLLGG